MVRGVNLVNVRILNEKGSETLVMTVQEAQAKFSEATEQGYLIVNDDTKEQILELGDVENILLVPPMAGG